MTVLTSTELDQNIKAGQKGTDTACQYVDCLVSTVNPNPDEDMWIRPEVHPCQKCHGDMPEHDVQSNSADTLAEIQAIV